jgi:hypothetical protein
MQGPEMAKRAIIRIFGASIAILATLSASYANAAPSQETLKKLSAKCFDNGSFWSGN